MAQTVTLSAEIKPSEPKGWQVEIYLEGVTVHIDRGHATWEDAWDARQNWLEHAYLCLKKAF